VFVAHCCKLPANCQNCDLRRFYRPRFLLAITGPKKKILIYLGATREFKEYYKKGIGVSEEIRLGSINKEELLKNKLPKGDLRRAVTKVLRSISFSIRRKSVLLLLSFYKPYFISFYSLKQTFLRTFLRRIN